VNKEDNEISDIYKGYYDEIQKAILRRIDLLEQQMKKSVMQKYKYLRGADYYNFFYTPGSIESLDYFIRNGWIVINMINDEKAKTASVLLQKNGDEERYCLHSGAELDD